MQVLREEQERRRKNEINEIEDRMNSHITALLKDHDKAFSDMNTFYNGITQKSAAVVGPLKVRDITNTLRPYQADAKESPGLCVVCCFTCVIGISIGVS